MKRSSVIPVNNSIVSFMHCRRCVEDIPKNVSPRNWSMVEAGWTVLGFQVWCRRHEMNIIHVSFEGQKHPAASGIVEEN